MVTTLIYTIDAIVSEGESQYVYIKFLSADGSGVVGSACIPYDENFEYNANVALNECAAALAEETVVREEIDMIMRALLGSPSRSPSGSPSLSPSASESPSESPSLSPSASESPSDSPSNSPSESPSASPST